MECKGVLPGWSFLPPFSLAKLLLWPVNRPNTLVFVWDINLFAVEEEDYSLQHHLQMFQQLNLDCCVHFGVKMHIIQRCTTHSTLHCGNVLQ